MRNKSEKIKGKERKKEGKKQKQKERKKRKEGEKEGGKKVLINTKYRTNGKREHLLSSNSSLA